MKMKKIFFYVILLLTLTCERSNRQAKIEEVNQESYIQALHLQNFFLKFAKDHLYKTVTIQLQKGISDKYQSIGSGFFINEEGYLLTCYHVVYGKNKLLISPYGSTKKYKAVVANEDKANDLALLKIDFEENIRERFSFVQVPQERVLNYGHMYVAFGAPNGLKDSITTGIISHPLRNEVDESFPLNSYIQLSETVYPGSSGGLVLDLTGKLIGMMRFTYSSLESGASGPGFAIPFNVIYDFLQKQKDLVLLKNKALRGIVEIPFTTTYLAKKLNLPHLAGMIVSYVEENSPAAKSGLRRYDFITHVEGEQVGNFDQFIEIMDKWKSKKVIELTIIRDSKVEKIKLEDSEK